MSGAEVTELRAGQGQVFAPQQWWALDGTAWSWTRGALWIEDSEAARLGGQCPVLGQQLGSHMVLPGEPIWPLLCQLSEPSRQSEVTVVTVLDEVG